MWKLKILSQDNVTNTYDTSSTLHLNADVESHIFVSTCVLVHVCAGVWAQVCLEGCATVLIAHIPNAGMICCST